MKGNNMAKVTIYTTPPCADCKMTKMYLTEKKIVFEEKDVVNDQKAQEEMIKKSNGMSVPVLDIDGKILIEPSKQQINEALGI